MVSSHKNKTVVDAVNALHGELHKCIGFDKARKQVVMAIHKEGFRGLYAGCYSVASFENGIGDRYWKVICTIDEFNQCVAEMSEGLFVPDCRPKQAEVQYDDSSNGWEVGAVYEFSDDRIEWFSGTFSEYSPNHKRKYVDDTESHWEFIRECKARLGKIHKKPVELVDGAAYQFEYIAGKFIGIYGKSDDLFYMSNHRTLNREHVKNIIKLVPESV